MRKNLFELPSVLMATPEGVMQRQSWGSHAHIDALEQLQERIEARDLRQRIERADALSQRVRRVAPGQRLPE